MTELMISLRRSPRTLLERFRTNPDRVRNREELVEILSARLRERGTAQWHEQLTSVGVPAAPGDPARLPPRRGSARGCCP